MLADKNKKNSTLEFLFCTTMEIIFVPGSQVEEVHIEPDLSRIERRMQHWLHQLRISAHIHAVSWEYPNESHEEPAPLPTVQHMQGYIKIIFCIRKNIIKDKKLFQNADERFDLFFSINHLIRQTSDNSAAIFVYLPSPPATVHGQSPEAEAYLNLLTELTQGLPPTVLVRGVSSVISTTLWPPTESISSV